MRITVQGLTKRFGPLEVVSKVGFSIEEGEMFTLLGPSGCGKTTLLRLIAGFYSPDQGEVLFDARVVNDLPPHERGIGMVFQNYALWPHMTVYENAAYGLKLRKVQPAEIGQRIGAVLEKVKLAGLEHRYPGQLSGGQQQRVALARALVLNPKILLLDEPLSNLDAKIRIQVRAEIRKLQKDIGITTVYVTHDQEEALTLSDRIAVFNKGQALQIGPPKELYERPANRFVADFIGINNMIDGSVRSIDPAAQRMRVATSLGELSTIMDGRLKAGDPCIVCVRPENAVIDGGSAAESNLVTGRVSFAAYMGHTLRYDIDAGQGITLKSDIRDPWHHEPLPMGSQVTVSFPVTGTVAIPAQ